MVRRLLARSLTLPLVGGGQRALSENTSVEIASGATVDVNSTAVIGSLSGSGTLNLVGLNSLSVGNSVDLGDTASFSGVISGSGDFTKQGAGSFVLSGENPGFSGNIVVEAGELILSKANALGSGNPVSVQDGATLVLDSSEPNPSSFSFENVLSLGSYANSPSGASLRLKGGSAQLTRPVSIVNLSSIKLLADGSELILSDLLSSSASNVIKPHSSGHCSTATPCLLKILGPGVAGETASVKTGRVGLGQLPVILP